MIEIVELNETEQLKNVDPDLFDNQKNANFGAKFIADPRHHMLLAIDNASADRPADPLANPPANPAAKPLVIGICSAVHYIHRDKETEL